MDCYKEIHKSIINCKFIPGERLTTSKLKKELNLNFGICPIREALSRLTEIGLVEVESGKGYRVAEATEKKVRDLLITLGQVELLLTKQSIQQGDQNWESRVVAALHKMTILEKSPRKDIFKVWSDSNINFHLNLVSGSRNSTLLNIHKEIYLNLNRYISFIKDESKTPSYASYEEHIAIAHSAINRDIEKACKLISNHYIRPIDSIISFLKENSIIKF